MGKEDVKREFIPNVDFFPKKNIRLIKPHSKFKSLERKLLGESGRKALLENQTLSNKYLNNGVNYSKYLDLQKFIKKNNIFIDTFLKSYQSKLIEYATGGDIAIKDNKSIKDINKFIKYLLDLNIQGSISMRDMINIDEDLLSKVVDVLSQDKEVKSYVYMKNDYVMTSISVKSGGKVHFVNFTDKPLDCAFGLKESPVGLSSLIELLEERCVPKNRFNIEEVLMGLGLSEYNEVDIVEKTYGVLIDDYFWIKESNDTISYKEACTKVGLGDCR